MRAAGVVADELHVVEAERLDRLRFEVGQGVRGEVGVRANGREVRAVREGYRALRALSVPITPPGLRVFEVMPEPLLVAILGRLLDTPTAELVIARHANAARAEYVQLGDEFLALAGMAGVATPAFDRLRPYVHAAPRPIPSATSSLPL